MTNNTVVFDFSPKSSLSSWKIINDEVMGGKSKGSLKINENGNAVFKGEISLENNGGFSSKRHQCNTIKIKGNSYFILQLKGDHKIYQFRVKANASDYYSYTYTFETNDKWEKIKIPFSKMKPVFRGRNLNMQNYSGESLEEIGFLIGNKKEEDFILEIDKILIE